MKKIACVIIAAIVLLFAFVGCSESKEEYPPETQSIVIKTNGDKIADIKLEDIMKMKSVVRRMIIHSAKGDETFDFKGTLLVNILDFADPNLTSSYNYVYIYGADEYVSCIEMDEVLQENNVYIMYADGDELLKTRTGEEGSMRLVAMKDYYGQRFTNYITEINLTVEELE